MIDIKGAPLPDHVKAWGPYVARAKNHLNTKRRHRLTASQAPKVLGIVGTMEGFFHGLNQVPCEGTLSLSISEWSYEFVGSLRVYDQSGSEPLQATLRSIDRCAYELAHHHSGIDLIAFTFEQSLTFRPMS